MDSEAVPVLVTLLSISIQARPLSPEKKSLRSLLGVELSEYLASGERDRTLDDIRARARLLQDLQLDTRAKRMWSRMVNDQPGLRKHKVGTKKGGSTSRGGCFGHKMDRIGTISGMGC
ncbi:C-type natriuretic peptide [Arapaima gigas]